VHALGILRKPMVFQKSISSLRVFSICRLQVSTEPLPWNPSVSLPAAAQPQQYAQYLITCTYCTGYPPNCCTGPCSGKAISRLSREKLNRRFGIRSLVWSQRTDPVHALQRAGGSGSLPSFRTGARPGRDGGTYHLGRLLGKASRLVS
jgi:hypothetical protein